MDAMEPLVVIDHQSIDCIIEEVATQTSTSLRNYSEMIEIPHVPHIVRENSSKTKSRVKVGRKMEICDKQEDVRFQRPVYCCVHSCTADSIKSNHLAFFRFPETPERCKIWTRFTKRRSIRQMDLNLMHSSKQRLCSAHFKLKDFVNTMTRNELVPDAIPSVYDAKDCLWYQDKDYKPGITSETGELFSQLNGSSTDSTTTSLVSTVQQKKIDRWDLCDYHRLVIRSVTLVGIELEDMKFCIKCGSRVNAAVLISHPNVYKISCKQYDHTVVVTTEFNEKFRGYVLACQDAHHSRGASDPPYHSPCHLCSDHYTPPHEINQQNGAVYDRKPLFVSNSKRKRGRPSKLQCVKRPTLPVSFPPLVSHLFCLPPTLKHTVDVSVSCCESKSFVPETKNTGTQLSAGQLKGPDEIGRINEIKRLREQMRLLEKTSHLEKICHLEKISNLEKKADKELIPFLSDRFVIENILPQYFKGVTLKLMEMQILIAARKTRARWPPSFLTLAKLIESESLVAYNIIRKLFRFPSKRIINKVQLLPSDMQSVNNFLKKTFPETVEESYPIKAKKMKTEDVQAVEELVATERMQEAEESDVIVELINADCQQLQLSANNVTGLSDVSTILDEAIKELELENSRANEGRQVEDQNLNTVVVEVMDGDSEMSRFRILGSAVQDYGTGVYQILAESVDSPEEGAEALEIRVMPSYNIYE